MPAEPAGGRALVIGYGNELRSDDGAGFVLAGRLALDPRLAGADVLAVRQLTPDLALDVSRARLLVLVDASAELAPGDVSSGGVEVAPSGMASSHQLSAQTLLGLALELYGAAPPALLVSVGVADIEPGEQLSSQVEAALPRAADEVVRILEGHRRA